jgi:hypothetical protein
MKKNYMIYDMIYALTVIGLTPGGSSTVHIYKQRVHRTTQLNNWEEYGPCSVFANYTLAFTLQLRKKYGKPSVRVRFNFIQGFKKIHKYKIS